MMSSVTLTSASNDDVTKITLSGLTDSGSADNTELKLYAGAECGTEPTVADVHDSTNPLRAASGTAVATATDQLVSPDGKAWMGKFDKEDGTLIVQIGTGFAIVANEVVTFSFKLQNGNVAKKSRALTASASGFYCTSNLCDSDDDEAVTIAPG